MRSYKSFINSKTLNSQDNNYMRSIIYANNRLKESGSILMSIEENQRQLLRIEKEKQTFSYICCYVMNVIMSLWVYVILCYICISIFNILFNNIYKDVN